MARVPDATVEMFEDSGLSAGEARIQTLRLQGYTQKEIAEQFDLSVGSVKSFCSRIDNDKTLRLPGVSKIELGADVAPEEDHAVVIWFDNDAKLQYRVDSEGTVYEEVFKAGNPDTVYQSVEVSIDPDELEKFALESLAEYVNTYRDDFDAIRGDWPHVFEAVTLLDA